FGIYDSLKSRTCDDGNGSMACGMMVVRDLKEIRRLGVSNAGLDTVLARARYYINLEERVKSIIVLRLRAKLSDLRADASFSRDLAADDYDMSTVIAAVEREFNISIPQTDAKSIDTVGRLISYLERRIE